MTERAAVLIPQSDVRVMRLKWLLIGNGDTGAASIFNTFQDRCVQVVGTFGAGGSISIEGSNDDGTTWVILTDPLGNALTFTSAGMKQITELPYQIRPHCTAGDGTTALAVWLHARGTKS
jgi:hypothetical protein